VIAVCLHRTIVCLIAYGASVLLAEVNGGLLGLLGICLFKGLILLVLDLLSEGSLRFSILDRFRLDILNNDIFVDLVRVWPFLISQTLLLFLILHQFDLFFLHFLLNLSELLLFII
jgi:hypothetical protein